MKPNMTKMRIFYTILPFLLSLRESETVTVLSVGLENGNSTLSLYTGQPAVLECIFKLEPGETFEELVWVRGGRLLQSSMKAQPTGVEVSEFYNITNLSRNSAGVYSCTVRTQEGFNATGRFELFVTDILSNVYYSSVEKMNCSYVISYTTPYAYPRGSAFCGIWVRDSMNGNETWLEPPPENMTIETMTATSRGAALTPALSYSSERGEFDEIEDLEGRIQFKLSDKRIQVIDTPRNSSVKCTFGYYSPTGMFYPASSIESTSYEQYNSSCLEEVPKKFISEKVTLKFSAYTHNCYGEIYSSSLSFNLTATLQCVMSSESKVLECKDDVWQLRVGDAYVAQYDEVLSMFGQSCGVATAGGDDNNENDNDTNNDDDDEDDGGSVAVLSLSLGVLSLAASLQGLSVL